MEAYLKHVKLLKDKITAPGVNVELEVRQTIIKPKGWNRGKATEVEYFKSEHKGVVIRRINAEGKKKGKVETKQVISRCLFNNFTICLSVEKLYRGTVLEIDHVRKYYRNSVKIGDMIIDITEDVTETDKFGNGKFTREIEIYGTSNSAITMSLVSYWPPPKPYDGYVSDIWNVFCNGGYMTYKLNGQRVLMYIGQKREHVIVSENGSMIVSDNNEMIENPRYVLDCELYDGIPYVFDVLCSEGNDVTNLNLEERLAMIPEGYEFKPYTRFNTFKEFCKAYHDLSGREDSDGIILTQRGPYRNPVFKSKPRPTVDLMYSSGALFLNGNNKPVAYEDSVSIPILEDGSIHEFLIDPLVYVKPRLDKISPNSRMPVNEDPVSLMVKGIGCRSMRSFHNSVKRMMLEEYSKYPNDILIDIGSGKGADMTKWKSFKKVYAIDPKADFFRVSNIPSNVVIIKKDVRDIFKGNSNRALIAKLSTMKTDGSRREPFTTLLEQGSQTEGFNAVISQDDNIIISCFFVPEVHNLSSIICELNPKIIMGISMIDKDEIQKTVKISQNCNNFSLTLIQDNFDDMVVNLRIPGSVTANDITENIGYPSFEGYKLIHMKNLDHEFMSSQERALSKCYKSWVFQKIEDF